MSQKIYDVAFAPINARLIKKSDRLGLYLKNYGISSCILKTYIHGEKASGWNGNINVNLPIVPIKPLCYQTSSNFFIETLRTVESTRTLNSNYKFPFKLLIVFMDRYADGGILTQTANRNKIPTLLFQEGFHARKPWFGGYQFNLYGIACMLRSIILKPWFGGTEGYRAQYAAVWSEKGLKDDMIKFGRKPESIFVVGCPIPRISINKKIKNKRKVIMFAHQTFNPWHSTQSWNDNFYYKAVSACLENDYKILFKPHPRHFDSKKINELRKNIENMNLNNKGEIEWVDKEIIGEDLLPKVDALVTGNSVTAYSSLRLGIPTFFIRTQFNRSSMLEDLGRKGIIIYLKNLKNFKNELKNILDNSKNKKYWKINGPLAANILSGDDTIFKQEWVKTVQKILNNF